MSSISSIGSLAVSVPALDPFFLGAQLPKPGTPEKFAVAPAVKPPGDVQKPTPTDQVEVSKAAEARLLRSQGVSLGEIEATLGVGESTVTSYLGITNGTQTLQAVATAAVESGAALLG